MKKNLLASAALLALALSATSYLESAPITPSKTIEGATLKGVIKRDLVLQVSFDGHSKLGTTAGFTIAAANNVSTVTANQAMTTATLVTRLGLLHPGDYITGYNYSGNIAASGTLGCTITANLRYMVPGATGPTDTNIATVTYVSRTYSALINGSNVYVSGIAHAIVRDANYYFLTTYSGPVSVTTTLQALAVSITAQ